jgi:hypothetical protein
MQLIASDFCLGLYSSYFPIFCLERNNFLLFTNFSFIYSYLSIYSLYILNNLK